MVSLKLPRGHIEMMDVLIDVSNKYNKINGNPIKYHEK